MSQSPKDELTHLFDSAEEYINVQKDLLQLKLVRKVSGIVSSLISKMIVGVVFLFFFILLNIGLGLLLGELFPKTYYGFFALAAFYLLIGFIVMGLGNTIIRRPVANNLIKTFIK